MADKTSSEQWRARRARRARKQRRTAPAEEEGESTTVEYSSESDGDSTEPALELREGCAACAPDAECVRDGVCVVIAVVALVYAVYSAYEVLIHCRPHPCEDAW